MNLKTIAIITGFISCLSVSGQTTFVTVSIPDKPVSVDPMIYGQMLEDCNDRVIYGGIMDKDGNERPHVTELLKPLNMPIVRWPAGTYIHEYDWEKGIGPKKDRPVVPVHHWGGVENFQFGTDEFLAWCKEVGTVPYINFNMGNQIDGGSLGDALNWLEYVNGSEKTVFGQKRGLNGHIEPYHVKYWCIGNENYESWGRFNKETAQEYSNRLHQWASTIKSLYPDVQLLGVGHTCNWNDTVLQQNGSVIDFLTLHFYMRAKVKDNQLEDEVFTTFSPAKIEIQIQKNSELLDRINQRLGRTNHPIRFSIDEWNCRHSVSNESGKYAFTRNDDRRLFDVATVAGMLNVMIRQSPAVGMANYIFPVNGHGLIKTVGETDAYRTPPYYLFQLYRTYMIGSTLETNIQGASCSLPLEKIALDGDVNKDGNSGEIELTYMDAVSVQTDKKTIHVALINRSPKENQKIKLSLPSGYVPQKMWRLESDNINLSNTPDNRNVITPQEIELSKKDSGKAITILPCGWILIRCVIK
jgi:alpha-N-arabinofuranosidase